MLLMIDNYDSFTFNLVQYFGELGQQVHVVRNDALTVDQAMALNPSAICISPGPCDPAQAGISIGLIKAAAGKIPLLGVCLGHQAIGEAFGGKVIRKARHQGRFGANHHKADVLGTAEGDDGLMVSYLQVHVAGDLVDAGIAGGHEELVAQRACGDGPGQGVFASAGADQQNVHD